MERVAFDLDGTLCTDEGGQYALARPIPERVAEVRRRYAAGDYIIIDSARGNQTNYDWMESTADQLLAWGIPYHELHVGRKPFAHRYVDDRAQQPQEFFPKHIDRWPDSYFVHRDLNDPRRLAAFRLEAKFMERHGVDFTSRVCDVGCSTGEFLKSCWDSEEQYGMEINHQARAKAMRRGVRFDHDLFNRTNYFGTVIFRGTIQHLPHPFRYLERAYSALTSGGSLVILATPNAGSLCYRLWQELPVSDPTRNYWMPSAKTLANALSNFGFEPVAVEYPYLGAGYARPMRDGLSFLRRLVIGGPTNFPFPGNMMNVIARRP